MANKIERRFSENHVWVNKEGFVGLSSFAWEGIGDGEIQYIELPDNESFVNKGDVVGCIEGKKSVFEIITPVGGRVMNPMPKLGIVPPTDEFALFQLVRFPQEEFDSLMAESEYKSKWK